MATTDPSGCATASSEPDALVTVAIGLDPMVPSSGSVLTTLAPSSGELVVHGPHGSLPWPGPIAGQVNIAANALPPPMPAANEMNFSASYQYSFGCTPIGCTEGSFPSLPATIDVPAYAIGSTKAIQVAVSAVGTGTVCCDAHGQPYSMKSSTSLLGLAGLGSTLDATFGCPPGCADSGPCTCSTWPISIDPTLVYATSRVGAMLEVAGSMWQTTVSSASSSAGGQACLDPGNEGVCWADIPAGLQPDDVIAVYEQDTPDSQYQAVGSRITSFSTTAKPIAIATTDLLPEIPRPTLFQDPTHHVLGWSVQPISADAVVVGILAGGPPWYVVLPPDTDHVTLPSDPSLPNLAYLPNPTTLWYVDSDDIDGFAALTAAGIHVDQADIGSLSVYSWIAPFPANRIRITSAQSL